MWHAHSLGCLHSPSCHDLSKTIHSRRHDHLARPGSADTERWTERCDRMEVDGH
jgi:hypothetical protein